MQIDPLSCLRAELAEVPEAERLDYALDLLAFYLAPEPRFFEGLDALGLRIGLEDARVLFALDRRRGQVVGVQALLAARYIDRPADDWGPDQRVTRAAFNLRRALTAARLPVTIRHVPDRGYCLEAPAGFRFEDAAPDTLFSISRLQA